MAPINTITPVKIAPIPLRQPELLNVAVQPHDLSEYLSLIPDSLYDEIVELSRPLRGSRIVLLNATAFGGGPAEMFQHIVPLMRSLGLQVEWRVMPPNGAFFNLTKQIHNALQGGEFKFTELDKEIYMQHNWITAKLLSRVNADIYEIHDPQPAAVAAFLPLERALWRCHIDTSTPNAEAWKWFRPLLDHYQEYMFTVPDFVPEDIDREWVSFATPTIHPYSPKNKPMGLAEARRFLKARDIDPNRPLATQVSRYDPWKDPWGVIDAYRLAKQRVPGLQLALIGSMASDDPEGPVILESVQKHAAGDPDIHLIVATENNDLEVNAFQTASTVVIQKSTREGFGMVVTEAMWKGQPVIGGNAAGIAAQIKEGHNGYLVGSTEECAERIVELVQDTDKASHMGAAARERVKREFLHPRLIRDHLKVYHKMLK